MTEPMKYPKALGFWLLAPGSLSRLLALLTAVCLSLSTFVAAEVQMVLITWTPQICQEGCAQGLQEYLSQIPQVSNVAVNMASGSATLEWKKNQPYSFAPINFATRVIGIPRILYARMRVRGTIQHSQGIYNIISTGDNTPIRLLSPIQPQPGQYTIQTSIDSHPLTPEMQQRLKEIELKRQTVIIDGTIFEPVRLTFPALIIESIKVEEKDQKK